jgi:hypothetical protein
VFIVGNGTGDGARNNALTVLKNGRTSIGDIIPQSQLHLAGSPSDWTKHIRLDNDAAGTEYGVILYDGEIKFRNFKAGAGFAFRNSANTTVGSLTSSGALTVTSLTETSDARLKKNITALENPMDALSQLHGYQYQWKEEWRGSQAQTGLLAQEVEQVIPALVREDTQGIKSVNYTGLIPYLVEAVKVLDSQNKELRERLAQLEKR